MYVSQDLGEKIRLLFSTNPLRDLYLILQFIVSGVFGKAGQTTPSLNNVLWNSLWSSLYVAVKLKHISPNIMAEPSHPPKKM